MSLVNVPKSLSILIVILSGKAESLGRWRSISCPNFPFFHLHSLVGNGDGNGIGIDISGNGNFGIGPLLALPH